MMIFDLRNNIKKNSLSIDRAHSVFGTIKVTYVLNSLESQYNMVIHQLESQQYCNTYGFQEKRECY